MNNISVGITGHRNYINKNKVEISLRNEIRMLNDQFSIKKVISPLAEGADRVFAKTVIELTNAHLCIPIPFILEEYIKDFVSEYSKIEFNNFINNSNISIIDNFIDNNLNPNLIDERNLLYKNVGEFVADNCDVLFAIWDGKSSNGVGGTAEIVNYSLNKNYKLIHINPMINLINKFNI